MTKRVASVNINDKLYYAANLMVKKKIGSLIVMDRGRVEGILTEHDFVKALADGIEMKKKVKDIMSHPVITLERSGSIFEACELMKKHHIKNTGYHGWKSITRDYYNNGSCPTPSEHL
jgi:CBS domain-containing protein